MLNNVKDIINYIRPLPLKGNRRRFCVSLAMSLQLMIWTRPSEAATHYDFTFFGV